MKNFVFTKHARARSVQRGISPELIGFILEHGGRERVNGAWLHRCPRGVRGPARELRVKFREKLAKQPYVLTEGRRILTAGYRYKRVKIGGRARKPRARRRAVR